MDRPVSSARAVWAAPLCAMFLLCALPQQADAFCGFYVSGATGELFNNATQVVMMREGMRTVLSMQNNYQGPPSDFAMVIPVPVVLQKENVKTLEQSAFTKIDQMAAPRLVEYWETDPCYVEPPMEEYEDGAVLEGAVPEPTMAEDKATGVKIEAQFKVGEYEIVILSAKDSSGLDTWLRQNKYNIPAGAEPVLRPYVESGTKFFVAKVDSKKVKFEGNKAVLSPLRFHYDSQDFSLPVRLGLLNANGPQDLIVHVLARGQRYEVANYPNVTIPTNIKVDDDVKDRFAEFYAALFDETVKQNKKAVITEYSWDAGSCDPCPGPTLQPEDFQTFGADVLDNKNPWGFVLTRLHARYTKDELGEDLVFKAAPPIIGGRGTPDQKGQFTERGASAAGQNNFQGRYAVLHRWEGEIKCQNPVRGRWGGPPPGKSAMGPKAAQDLANAPRGKVELAKLVREDVPPIKLKSANVMPPIGEEEKEQEPAKDMDKMPAEAPKAGEDVKKEGQEAAPSKSGCHVAPGQGSPALPGFLLLGLGWFLLRRQRKG